MEDTPTPIAEIDHGPSKFEVFMEENQKKLIALAAVIFLGTLAYVFFSGYGEMKEQNAGAELVLAKDADGYKKVEQSHPDTKAAGSAKLLLSDLQAQTSTESAVESLESYLSTYPDHAATPSAKARLGSQLFDAGKLTEAEAQLNSALDGEGSEYIAPFAKLLLGDIALKNGNKEKAKTLYTEVSKLDQDGSTESIQMYSGFIGLAKSRLRFLDAKAPREVQPKPVTAPQNPAPAPAIQPVTPAQPAPEAAAPEQQDTPAEATPDATPEENNHSEENQEKNSQE